jgi:hypothetical protein
MSGVNQCNRAVVGRWSLVREQPKCRHMANDHRLST